MINLETDKVYWVAGKGPMRLIELPNPPKKTSVTMESSSGYNYWADASELSIITPDGLRFHIEQLQSRTGGVEGEERIFRVRGWAGILAQ